MATIRLYLDKRAAKGEAPVKISINHKSESAFIPTGIKVNPEQWDGNIVTDGENSKRINSVLLGKKVRVERILLELEETTNISTLSAKEIRDRIWNRLDPERRKKEELKNSFLTRFERFIELKDRKNTKDSYSWSLKKIREFDPELDKRRFEDIDTDYLKELNSFHKELSVNSKSILFRNIRAVFNDALDARITHSYPFRSYTIKNEPTKKKALSLQQLRTLSTCDSFTEYRDMFLLMVYLRGINIGDLLLAKKNQVVNGRFEYRRNKVGTLFSIKIEPEAFEILERYKGKDYLHHLNAGLKKIGSKRGKNRKIESEGLFPMLSSNWARHTWATIGVSLDIPKEIITRGMGHSFGVRVTDIYIDFDMKKVDEANRKIIDAILCK